MKKVLTITIAFLVLIFGIIVVGLTTAQENKVKEVQPIQSSEKCQLVYIDSTIPVIKPFYTTIANYITENERETLARLVYLEARGQSYLGQKAVVEVVLNRVLSDEFPNTIDDVIYQKNQFSPAKYIETTTPTQIQYDVVDEVLSEIYPVLNTNVLFFSTKQYNDLLYEQIGNHYFCYSTKSYQIQKGN